MTDEVDRAVSAWDRYAQQTSDPTIAAWARSVRERLGRPAALTVETEGEQTVVRASFPTDPYREFVVWQRAALRDLAETVTALDPDDPASADAVGLVVDSFLLETGARLGRLP